MMHTEPATVVSGHGNKVRLFCSDSAGVRERLYLALEVAEHLEYLKIHDVYREVQCYYDPQSDHWTHPPIGFPGFPRSFCVKLEAQESLFELTRLGYTVVDPDLK